LFKLTLFSTILEKKLFLPLPIFLFSDNSKSFNGLLRMFPFWKVRPPPQENAAMLTTDAQDEIHMIVDRLEKLSHGRPENPGVAYRNLENISALTHTLKERLGFSKEEAG
jgi:hypothetical protein